MTVVVVPVERVEVPLFEPERVVAVVPEGLDGNV